MFMPIMLKFFMVTQETIIYRLVMRNHDFYSYLWQENGRARKMGVAATLAAKGMGKASRHDQKVGRLSGPFGPTTIVKSCYRNSRLEPPPLQLKCLIIITVLPNVSTNRGMWIIKE